MPENYAGLLNPEKARIFRIIHRANLPWVLDHGLHCGSSPVRAQQWVSIGNQELISTRARWPVNAAPGGLLNDYVPFYFTPFSVMMRNITTGLERRDAAPEPRHPDSRVQRAPYRGTGPTLPVHGQPRQQYSG